MLLPFFLRRVLQSTFAAERDWEQYHTPRNLLLALVSYLNWTNIVRVTRLASQTLSGEGESLACLPSFEGV